MAQDKYKYTVQEAITITTDASSSVLTDDGQVKATAGSVIAVMVSINGFTAADKIEIKNSTDNSGTALISFVATAAAQSWMFTPGTNIPFDTAIFVDVTKSGGTCSVTTVYI